MLGNITSLTGNGLKDWLIQRVTAVYFAVYCIFLLVYLGIHPQLEFSQWQALFHHPLFQIASAAAVVALSLHAWIGIWTVTTDYIKCTALRLSVQMFVLTWLIAQFIACLMILWGR